VHQKEYATNVNEQHSDLEQHSSHLGKDEDLKALFLIMKVTVKITLALTLQV